MMVDPTGEEPMSMMISTEDEQAGQARPGTAGGLRAFARDSGFVFSREVLGALLSLATSILAARALGPVGLGVYGVALLLPRTLFALLDLGISPGIIFFGGRKEIPLRTLMWGGKALALALGLGGTGIALAILVFASDALFPGVPPTLLALASLGLAPLFLSEYLVALIVGLQDFKTSSLIRVGFQVAWLILMVIFVYWLKLGAVGALASWVLAQSGMVAAADLVLQRRPDGGGPEPGSRRATVRKLLGYGLRAHFGNLASFMGYRLDRFILNALTGPSQVGLYLVAAGLGERIWMVSRSVSSVLFPRIAELEGDERNRQKLTALAARYGLWASFLAAAVVAALSRWLIRLAYGSDFVEASSPLLALLPGVILLAYGRILSHDLAGRGRPELNSYVSILSLGVNVGANLLLIPRLAAVGAALASSLSYGMMAVAVALLYGQVTGLPVRQTVMLGVADFRRLGEVRRELARSFGPKDEGE